VMRKDRKEKRGMGERDKDMKKKNRNKKPRNLKHYVLYNIVLRYGLWEEKRNRDWRRRRR